MLKNFFKNYIFTTILFTILANLIIFCNLYKKETELANEISDNNFLSSENSSYFVSDSQNLFWPTPRISQYNFKIWK